ECSERAPKAMRPFEFLGGPSRGERQDAEHGKSEPDQDRRKRDQECGSFHGVSPLPLTGFSAARLPKPRRDSAFYGSPRTDHFEASLSPTGAARHLPAGGTVKTASRLVAPTRCCAWRRSDGSLLPPTSWPRRPLSHERRA